MIYDCGDVLLAMGINANDISGPAICLGYHGPAPSVLGYSPPPKRDKTVMGAW